MINKLSVKNFRSIEDAEVTLAPITVLYGPTSSGKSTLLYSLLVLRNFSLNPNQPADGYFNLNFMNLGGFDACVFNHEASKGVTVSIAHGENDRAISYNVSMS